MGAGPKLVLNKALLNHWASEPPCPETGMARVEVAEMGGGDGRGYSQSVPRGSGPRLTGTEQACTDPSKQLCMLPAEASHSQGWL